MRGISCTLLASLALLAASAMAGNVYRTVDAHGVVTYSDRPENGHSQLIHVNTDTPESSSSAAQQPTGADNSPGHAKQAAAASTDSAPAKPTPAELAAQRQKNCKIAQQRQQRYATAHRLYRKTPDGGRKYLNSKQIDAARTRAAADVQKWCG